MQAMDGQGRPVELTAMVGGLDADMPASLLTDRGTVAIWGDVLDASGMPDGEAIVETSLDVLREAARAVF